VDTGGQRLLPNESGVGAVSREWSSNQPAGTADQWSTEKLTTHWHTGEPWCYLGVAVTRQLH